MVEAAGYRNKPTGYELVIGLVGAIGVNLDQVAAKLAVAFDLVGYETQEISLIEPVLKRHREWPCPSSHYEDACHRKIDIGNELRRSTGHKDILATVAMAEIRRRRSERSALDSDEVSKGKDPCDEPIERCAYLLKSLKTKDEVDTLRRVYRDNCLIVAAYSSASFRKIALTDKIASSHSETNKVHFEADASRLMERDERESGESFGQNVQDTFCIADVFVDAEGDEQQLEKDIRRFVELLFGHPYKTPTRSEFAMFQAFGAARCSASAGRQVGAAIVNKMGDLLAVGVNEVAKAGGGQYFEGDDGKDGRDHERRTDSNAEMNRHVLEDLLARLQCKGWLSESRMANDVKKLIADLKSEGLLKPFSPSEAVAAKMPSLLKSARVLHGIEFIRAVHAEMSALMSMVRCGLSAKGCTMYVTTFPCHECAKHIVAAGVEQVVFVEPYPKSRVIDLFNDSIVLDRSAAGKNVLFQPFVGIAPRRYLALFEAPCRKDEIDDAWIEWDSIRKQQKPRLGNLIQSYVTGEKECVAGLDEQLAVLEEKGILKSQQNATN